MAGSQASREDWQRHLSKIDALLRAGDDFIELATNASKYGALSRPDGRVVVQWKIKPANEIPRFRMSWRAILSTL